MSATAAKLCSCTVRFSVESLKTKEFSSCRCTVGVLTQTRFGSNSCLGFTDFIAGVWTGGAGFCNTTGFAVCVITGAKVIVGGVGAARATSEGFVETSHTTSHTAPAPAQAIQM